MALSGKSYSQLFNYVELQIAICIYNSGYYNDRSFENVTVLFKDHKNLEYLILDIVVNRNNDVTLDIFL